MAFGEGAALPPSVHNHPVATHSISIDTAPADAPIADVIELSCGPHGPPVRIAPGSGRTWRIVASDAAACGRLAREAMRSPAVERVPGRDGLLSATTVLENIVLPAVYHARVPGERLAQSVYDAFDACGMERGEADRLCACRVADLDGFEQRLVCLLRALLMRPAVLLCERIFEGLPHGDMERVARFPAYYRCAVARGTVLFLDLAGMACPEIAADVQVDAV